MSSRFITDRCEVAEGDDFPVRCGDPAPFLIRSFGPAFRDVEVRGCTHHAAEAIEAGNRVVGPNGEPCRIDDTSGDVYEIGQPWSAA